MPILRPRKHQMKRTVLKAWSYKSVTTRKGLIQLLDVLCSKIVRKETPYCVTCGTTENLTCSHFYKRGYLIIRFDFRNLATQCATCNEAHNYSPWAFTNWFLENRGVEVMGELHALRMSGKRPTDDELRALVIECKARLKR